MAAKLRIKRTDADFGEYEVFIHGSKQDMNRVISADAERGEIWRYQIDEEGNILPAAAKGKEPPVERAVGVIAIKPKAKKAQDGEVNG